MESSFLIAVRLLPWGLVASAIGLASTGSGLFFSIFRASFAKGFSGSGVTFSGFFSYNNRS